MQALKKCTNLLETRIILHSVVASLVNLLLGIKIFFLCIPLQYKSQNMGSSWQKQLEKRARIHKMREARSSRWNSATLDHHPPPRLDTSQKTKRGLRGFANGNSTAAIADTGAAQNVVSLAFVQTLGLDIRPSSHKFQLGSSKQIISLGKTFPQPTAL